MKRFRGKLACFILSSTIIMGISGCEKKADVIEGNTETTESSSSTSQGKVNTEPTTEVDHSRDDNESSDSGKWEEVISGMGEGSLNVSMDVNLGDYSGVEGTAVTVEVPEFDKSYIHSMCDAVFDSGEIEVYDFDHKTKRVYEDTIHVYEETLELYDFYDKHDDKGIKNYYKKFDPYGCFFAMDFSMDDFERSRIEDDIDRLRFESESAPESIENDYSYGGYIGKIDGEEYYMYFGNRNYDEYFSSPVTYQLNGRVITIMKKDLESAYRGEPLNEYLSVKYDDDQAIISDMPLYREAIIDPHSFAIKYSINGMPEDTSISNTNADVEAYVSKGEQFINKLGFGNYVFDDDPRPLTWGYCNSEGFMYVNNYYVTAFNAPTEDGYILRYYLDDVVTLPEGELYMDEYVPGGDAYHYESYIDVMINESGIIGCQIYNPVKVIKTEPMPVSIDNDQLKDIVRDSIKNSEGWNKGIETDLFTVSHSQLVSFPIRSEKNKNEYTYVPCYIMYGNLPTYISIYKNMNATSPMVIVNANDGSLINITKELTDYPDGWNNGNNVALYYFSMGENGTAMWTRYEKLGE